MQHREEVLTNIFDGINILNKKIKVLIFITLLLFLLLLLLLLFFFSLLLLYCNCKDYFAIV